MEGSAQGSVGTQSSWLRCYRCWSQNLEVQLHYEGILKVDADTGEAVDPVEEVQEAVVQCLDCLHDQPHLALTFYDEDGRRISRIEPVEDRWERMVTGTPWVASCTVAVDAGQVESCSGPEAAESLAFAAFGDNGTREFFTHVRFHKHEEERIVIHMLVELYARSSDEATDVMEEAARGELTITSLGEDVRGVLAQERRRRGLPSGRAPDRRGHELERPRRRVVDRDRRRPARGRRGRQRVGHGAHLSGGHAGGVEGREPVLCGALAEPVGQQRHELGAVLDAGGIRREARILRKRAE